MPLRANRCYSIGVEKLITEAALILKRRGGTSVAPDREGATGAKSFGMLGDNLSFLARQLTS